jgi:hypothetical protein
MEDRYTFHNGEWCYSNGDTKKIVIDCNMCQTKKNLTEMEKYECKICERLRKNN